jgi:hypothetical protein
MTFHYIINLRVRRTGKMTVVTHKTIESQRFHVSLRCLVSIVRSAFRMTVVTHKSIDDMNIVTLTREVSMRFHFPTKRILLASIVEGGLQYEIPIADGSI